jgi:1-acyl-sn-glycerol-3-phosphate acyltransferase
MSVLYALGYSLTRLASKLVFRIKTRGQQNFPKTGGFILAANHISYYDPTLVGSWAPRVVCFMAKRELFKNPLFGAVLRNVNALPLNRIGLDRLAIKVSLDKIAEGYGLVVFPEGTRSKTGAFREPRAGVGMLARRAGCPIIPAYIQGPNRLRDCFLGRERMCIIYGEPISEDWVAGRPEGKEGYHQITQRVMARIGQLKEEARNLK